MSNKNYILIALAIFLLGVAGYFVLSNKSGNAEEKYEDLLLEEVSSPEEVSQGVSEKEEIVVDLAGAVKEPGVYRVDKGSILNDLIELAGGFSAEVSDDFVEKDLNLARLLRNHEKIYVESIFDKQDTDIDEEVVTEDEGSIININSASTEELESLVGIGPSTAEKIIEGRPYGEVKDILEVPGIGEATYENIKEDIEV
jgi:competence protein ComEA